MMNRGTVRALAVSGAIAATILATVGVAALRDSGSRSLPVKVADLPAGSEGWMLCWAGGLVAVGHDPAQYLAVEEGRVRPMVKTSCDAVPLSKQCERPIIFSWFQGTQANNLSSSLGTLDLTTGQCDRILPASEATWLYPLFYYRGQFWSPDFDTVVAGSMSRRHAADTLIFASMDGKTKSEWRVPRGRIRSFAWTKTAPQQLLVLTVGGGHLYCAPETEPRLRIPALDEAKYAMLSPAGDRAIGFKELRSSPYYVEFSDPGNLRPLKLDDERDAHAMDVGLAVWSPAGRHVALMLRREPSSDYELYIGDPASKLRLVRLKGWRLPRAASDEPFALCHAEWSAAWASTGEKLYYLMVSAESKEGSPRCAVFSTSASSAR